MAVTETVNPFETIGFSWQAARPGNWIYHCHYATHLSTLVELDTENGVMDESMLNHHASDRPHQMFGLVLGITIAPKGLAAASPTVAGELELQFGPPPPPPPPPGTPPPPPPPPGAPPPPVPPPTITVAVHVR